MTNIQVEDLSVVKKKITFEVPEETMTSLLDAEYRDLKRNVQIKGFRKGKVPLNILRSYFKSKVEADVVRKAIDETFEPALDEKKIMPVSVIRIEPETFESGKPFKYTAEIEVTPPIEVKGYKGLKLNRTVRTLDERQVDERLERLRETVASLDPIPEDRGVQPGDHLVADIKASVDGQPISSLTVTDYHLELGRDFYLPGFDSKLEGIKPDETNLIALDLPDTFPRKDMAGKTAEIEVVIKQAKVRVLPELDDDFAKDLGEYETIEQVKEDIRRDIREMLENETMKELRNQIVDGLIELNEIEVPESMVDHQIDARIDQSMRSLAAQGIDIKRLPPPSQEQRDQMRPQSLRTVQAGLLLKAVGEQEHIEVSDDELDEGIKKRANAFGLSPDLLKDRWAENNMLEEFRASLIEDKIYELIEAHAEITDREAPAKDDSTEEQSGSE
ncbi:MAG: trigger factor [Desulfomonilaceae bacterium]|nr:trigger factor [Desulfomonilaceae bacterium]